jgi:protein involved in polysaccharide export with SLBB domain
MPANENGLPVSENLLLISKNISEPDEYILGAGDRLFISIRGVDEQNIDVIITPEGTVFIPGVGVVQLRDLSLSDGKDKLKDEISNNFKDVEVDISILDVKIINVNLIGDVIKPSSQNVPAVARLNDLVSTSAGLNVTADLRDIIIIDKNGVSRSYDLLKYYRYGDKSNNPYLTDASIVKIKKADKIISIYGAVPNFGFYEFKEDEYADELIELAGGITDHGREDSIEVISFMDDNKTLTSRYFNLKELITSKVKLKVGDKIVVREKPEYLTDRLVTVKGFIKSPGVYKIQKGVTTLKDVLLNEAGGFLEDASLKDSYIIRSTGENENEDPEFERLKLIPIADMTEDEYDYFKAKAREKKGRMIVDFEKLFIDNKVSENIILKKGDNIVIPEAKNYISIVGQVVNPGNIIYKENFSVDNYIETAGGFSWRAIESDVRIIKANTGEWVEADDVEKLEPGDIIWVPEELPAPRFWDVFIDALTIVGQAATVVAAVVAVVIASRN